MLPVLSPAELRVLGTLIEKSRATPDYYPMTLNSLTAACNQKTSRHPVTDYTEETIQQAVNSLKAQSLVATAVGGGSRTLKYKHNFGTVFDVSDGAIAVLCLLILRGPQTAGELNTNSGRLYEFGNIDEVHDILNELKLSEPPFIVELHRRAGQKENRNMHLFGGEITEELSSTPEIHENSATFEERITVLENEVKTLQQKLERLLLDLGQ